jgi:hypothetical protein
MSSFSISEQRDVLGPAVAPNGRLFRKRLERLLAFGPGSGSHQLVSITPGETALTRRGASSRASGGTVAS